MTMIEFKELGISVQTGSISRDIIELELLQKEYDYINGTPSINFSEIRYNGGDLDKQQLSELVKNIFRSWIGSNIADLKATLLSAINTRITELTTQINTKLTNLENDFS